MKRSPSNHPPCPRNEPQRLAALRETALLDTPPEREFDEVAALAAEICGTPIALVSQIDETRQWFKARVGLDVRETPRDVSFCAHALELDDLLVVPDATADPRFADNPLVRGEPGIRFYAGAPLKTAGGETLGTLCVIDRRPRELTARERGALRVLAGTIVNLIRLRRSEASQRALAQGLATERQRLADAQAVAKIGSWETDLGSLEVLWSDETHRIFETDPLTFAPTHPAFLAFVHPDDRAAVDTAWRESLDRRTPQSLEHRIVLPDGRVKTVEERWQIFSREEGRPPHAVGTCQDVTEQRRATAERDRLYALSLDLLCVADFDGRLQQVSPAWTRVLGWSAAELTSRPMRDFLHPDDEEATQSIRDTIHRGEPVRGFENRYRAKDGSYRWLSWNVQPTPESRQVFAVARDVTDQRENAEQMRLLDACVSHLNDVVVITEAGPIDEPGPRIIYVNPAFERVTGYTRAEAIGRSPRFLQGPRTQRAALDEIRRALTERQPVRTEVINYAKSGREYWLEIDIVPVFGPAGRFTHAIAIERDITERKAAEETLRRNEALLRMASRVSRLGAWQVEVPGLRITWSEEVGAIHETPAGFTPDVDHAIAFYVPACRDRVRTLLDACIAEGTSFDEELQIITARGRPVWVRVLGEAGRDAAGTIVRVQGAIEDISERKAEESLARRRESLQRIGGKIARVGGWAIEVPGDEVFWSDEVCRLLDYPAGVVPPLDEALALYPPDSREKMTAALAECARAGTPFDLELEIQTATGRRVWVRVSGEAERSPDGGVARIIGALQDITEHRRAQEETLRLAERLARTLESITDAFFTVDSRWCFNFLNSEAERLLRRSRSELLGRYVWAEFPEAVGTIFQKEYERAMADNVTAGFEAYYPPLATWFYVRAYPSEQGLAVYFRDITAERKADEELRRANESLVGIVDALHEIGTSEGTVDEVMTTMAGRAQALTGATGAAVEILEGEAMVYQAGSGALADQRGLRVPVGTSLSGLALRSGRALICDDAATDPRVDIAACRAAGVRSMIVAPLRDGTATVGVLKVMSAEPGAFTQRDVRNLQILVETLGAVIQRHRAAGRLRASEEQYRLLFADNPHPMLTADEATGRILAANSAAMRRYGHSETEFRLLTLQDLRPPEDCSPDLPALRGLRRGPHPLGRVRQRTKAGEIFDAEITLDNVVFDGRPARLLLVHDVSERVEAERREARATRALLMHSRCSESLIRANDEGELLRSVCAIAVEVGGFSMAWVGYALDDAARTIAPQAAVGDEHGYLAEIKLSWAADDPTGQGPAATSVRTGRAAVAADVTDPGTGFTFRDAALRHGYRAVVCLPLRESGRSFGILALYLREKAVLPDEEVRVLQDLADDLAFGIRNLQARADGRRTQDAVLAMARGVSAAVGGEFFRQLTLGMVEALGADAGFVAKLDPEKPGVAATLCAVEDGRIVPNFVYQMAGLPCEHVDASDLWVVERDAGRRFPHSRLLADGRIESFVGRKLVDTAGRPVGLMFVHFRTPLTRPDFVTSTLKIFATRAASEIERQVADAKTREQAALLDKARDAIILRDLDHRVLYWNKSAERLYGWPAAEVAGRSVLDLFYVDPEQFRAAEAQVRQAGEWTGELSHRSKDGRLLVIEGRWTLVRDDAGQPRAVLAINTDVSERKAMQQQLMRSQRMESIGTLAGGIAHDLNNLLAPITMGIDLLRREPAIPPDCQPIIDTIRRSADRGASLVRQVLSFARGVESDKVALDIRHVVREVESIAENTFPKNIAVETNVPPDLPLIVADPTQLNQVLLNLCVNARDAMPNGGRLTLGVQATEVDEQYAVMHRGARPGRYLAIDVADTGSGMTREVMDRIFEPFFTTKEFGKGTGLGLATVMSVVRSHGGFVSVSSEVGRGSTFRIHLPLPPDVVQVAPATDDDSAPPAGRGELILVVDDEAVIREVTQKTLEAAGYQVVTAEDGAQAISRYAQHRDRVALVLTDMMMPVMDGPALARALRRLDPGVRIVTASGLAPASRTAGAGETDLAHSLAKPYSANVLLKTVRAVLDAGSGPS